MLGRDPRHFGQQRQGLDLAGAAVHQRDPLGDVLGIVADPLDHAGDLERGDGLAKVACHRRAKRDQLDRALLGLDLERVELRVVLDDSRAPSKSRWIRQRMASPDRMFGESAHLADQRAKPIDVLVERLDRMPAGLLLHIVAPISRSGQ